MKLSLNRSTYTYTSPPSTPCSRPVKLKARHVIWCTFIPHTIEIPSELISCLFWFGFFSNLDPSRTVHHVTTRVCGKEVGSRRTLSDKQCILILQWKADQHFFICSWQQNKVLVFSSRFMFFILRLFFLLGFLFDLCPSVKSAHWIDITSRSSSSTSDL